VSSALGTVVSLAIWHDPVTIDAWRAGGGIGEALLVAPLLLFPIGVVSGAQGAFAGWVVNVGLRWRAGAIRGHKSI
jgi:hypothetical protein